MEDKEIVWLHGEVRTPPFSAKARVETGAYLRELQQGLPLSLPHSRPMPSIGARCHELRIPDEQNTWRIIYRIDRQVILVADVFAKKTRATPPQVISNCKRRFNQFDND